MKNASFRQKLLTSFLAIGILPLLICTLLMLNIFRLSLTRSAADAAETQLDAMSGELSGLLSDCETVMEKLCAEPAVAAALDRSELDEQRVYSVLYRAAAPVLGGASLSVYGADGRQLYSTSSQPASGSLSPRWGLLAAAADGGVVSFSGYKGAMGYVVIIDHQNGFKTYYEHNSSLLVSAGQTVYKGQQVAKAGRSGVTSGVHCHFGIQYNGTYYNPLNYLS